MQNEAIQESMFRLNIKRPISNASFGWMSCEIIVMIPFMAIAYNIHFEDFDSAAFSFIRFDMKGEKKSVFVVR